jgi:hydroxymethylbilane synthase
VSDVRVGTRASVLALTQTRLFMSQLAREHPHLALSEVHIQTAGDISTAPLNTATEPGLFVSALRDALLAGEVDIIVHSMKDLPAAPLTGIVTACVPARNDSRDGLVSKNNLTLTELPPGAVVGTSSPRRTASIRSIRPDLRVIPIRGNVDTRIAKVHSGDFDATILAMAGLNRIGRADVVCEIFESDRFVPAAGQGALSIECRTSDSELISLLSTLDDAYTRLTTAAERSVLLGLDAGCATAIGAISRFESGTLHLTAQLSIEESGESELVEISAPLEMEDIDGASQLGLQAAGMLRSSHIATRAAWT